MKVAVLQSNYIPWKGYFDIIHDVDLFIFHDDLQYTKHDWRNRNRIQTEGGLKWLTVPVGTDEHRLILDVSMQDTSWQKKHYDMICAAYRRAPYFEKYRPFLEQVYLSQKWDYLYELDRYLIEHISTDFLGIQTKFADSRAFATHGVKHEKLLSMLQSAGADLYVSGPAAKDYICFEDYQKAGIQLVWKDYGGYPVYPQQYGEFEHGVSILDLLLNTGEEAPDYIWGWRK
ncbi:MAG: WbqC family protein [Clostridia bacterium]